MAKFPLGHRILASLCHNAGLPSSVLGLAGMAGAGIVSEAELSNIEPVTGRRKGIPFFMFFNSIGSLATRSAVISVAFPSPFSNTFHLILGQFL